MSISDEILISISDKLRDLGRQLAFEETGLSENNWPSRVWRRWSALEWQEHVRGLASGLYAVGDPIEDLQPRETLYDPLKGGSAGRLKDEAIELIETLRQSGKLPQPPAGRAPRRDESVNPPVDPLPDQKEHDDFEELLIRDGLAQRSQSRDRRPGLH